MGGPSYSSTLDEFILRAESVFRSSPYLARYSLKYRAREGRLVLKMTDNSSVIMYATHQASDLRKIERFNNRMFALMSRGTSADTDSFLAQQEAEAQAAHLAMLAGKPAAH